MIINNNTSSDNNDDDKNNGYDIRGVRGHVMITKFKGDHNVITVSVADNIKTNNPLANKLCYWQDVGYFLIFKK